MWAEIFVVGTFWFWALVAAASVILFALIECERFGWATTTLILAFLALHLLGDFNILTALRNDPTTVGLVVLGYFAAGTIWAVGKWWFFVKRLRRQYEKSKRAFLEENGLQGSIVPDQLKAEWSRHADRIRVGYGRHHYLCGCAPKVSDHKGQVLGWMIYWPWSLVWTIINDPVIRLFKWIYRQIQGLLQGISDRAFRGVEDDFRQPPAAPDGKEPESDEAEDDFDGIHQPDK